VQLGELIGQARATTVLQNAIRRDRVAHAYLFWGPEGVGKSTAAVLFAQALNCLNDEASGSACGECQSCQLIARWHHPDVRLITTGAMREGAERTEISIDQIRQNPKKPRETPRPLIQDAYLRSALGRYKVYLVDPADRMSAEAANALLRVLEDAPPHVVLVLVTSHPSMLLPTVLSRCQQVAFQLAGTAAIEERLLALGTEVEAAAWLARLSGGRVGWALRAARQPEVLATRKALLDLCADLERQPVSAGLRMAEEVRLLGAGLAQAGRQEAPEEGDEEEAEEGLASGWRPVSDRALRAELPWCLEVMASWYRDCLAAAEGAALVNGDFGTAISRASGSLPCWQAEAAIEAILATRQQIERNANIDLSLECLCLRLLGGGE
jgi:DNA polymerase-3 subunit delta'